MKIFLFIFVTAVCLFIAHFSKTYLHREKGIARFFFLLFLFYVGISTLLFATTIDAFYFGWEIVGMTSVLLIGFFFDRPNTVHNALQVFTIYKLCDCTLLLATLLIHYREDHASIDGLLHAQPQFDVALLMIATALGKSAQFPFSFWLPKALEGPTPSSALFYGGLSIHLGPALLLYFSHLWFPFAGARILVGVIGFLSVTHALMVRKTQSDAKSLLAYATIIQIGCIWMEIALALHALAWCHMLLHISLRLFQFLRAPSALQDHLSNLSRSKPSLLSRLPVPLQRSLYALSFHRWHFEYVWEFCVETIKSLVKSPKKRRSLQGFLAALTLILSLWDVYRGDTLATLFLAIVFAFASLFSEQTKTYLLRLTAGLVLLLIALFQTDAVSSSSRNLFMMNLGVTLFIYTLLVLTFRNRRILKSAVRQFAGNHFSHPLASYILFFCALALCGFPGTIGYHAEDLVLHDMASTQIPQTVMVIVFNAIIAVSALRYHLYQFSGKSPNR